MRKHGWQLPYHPLQVVAIAVFLALGFAFYVFFLPFVGKKAIEYVVLGLYTPLVACVFFLYVYCAATDPADPGVFKSKKYLIIDSSRKQNDSKNLKQDNSVLANNKPLDEGSNPKKLSDQHQRKDSTCCNTPILVILLEWCPLSFVHCCFHAHEQSSEHQKSEDGMFYCSLCEVEVLKYSKHCRVCDKCVDGFDHHCRWLNNCIGRRNYRRFFVLMISALLLLILQWCIGILVLILCFLERKRFSVEISAKLGSSFSLVPFIIVVASCTVLAMLATLPLAQLFFFHVLLIKKGISTYDYIVALREQEQEQQGGGQQSPQMSSVSSYTGLSSASSFTAFRRDAWCTPPRLFLEDQFDVVPPEVSMPNKTTGRKMIPDESGRKKSATVKISPWTLARLNAEEVSKAAAEAKKKSKILQPVTRRETPQGHETDSSFGSHSGRMVPILDNKRRTNKRGRLATMDRNELQPPEASSSLAPLQRAARSAFRTSRAMSSTGITASSPDSSLGSPDLHPFRVSSSGAEDLRGLMPLPSASGSEKGIQLLRSTSSDGYEASGGEDSDRVPSRIVHRSFNWSNLLFNSSRGDTADGSRASSSIGLQTDGR
ncbi:uncharacterized protein A4U43_C08F13630 [Asparagus officinalis]|uniref:probable protein S-acyltransferase 22 n=1 Tax=Asparagus officinalis TaxID=4686 RepID=UPI00098E3CD8|nr:probable protein S-acyltransferase 22 [Asparagus officinalis]ONK60046.1 uncharacterized protein A4U43_C08F13630 [Asparagus officinalis]